MSNIRAEKSKKSVIYGLLFQALYLVFTFVKRIVMLKTAGLDNLSINQLLTDVIAVMEIADLGVWQAMTYHLYGPLAKGDKDRVASVMRLFKQSYWIIAGALMAIGLAFLPFSTSLLKGIEVNRWYFYGAYLLVLLKVAVPYLIGYKTALLNADQKAYMYLPWHILATCVMTVIEIIALYLTHSLIVYLVIDMLYNILLRYAAAKVADKEYPYLKDAKPMPKEERKSIFTNVKRTLVTKVSNKVLNQTDNILISTIVSTLMVGIYSQYSMFTNGFLRVFAQINSSIMGSIGNVVATESREYTLKTYRNITYAFFVMALFVASCFYSSVGPFIIGIIGKEYTVNQTVLILVTTNLFLEIIKMPLWTFFDASGYFKFDQVIALIACIINLVTSIVLGKMWGMTGIFIGTMISLLFMMLTKIIFFYRESSMLYEGLISYILYASIFAITLVFAGWVANLTAGFSPVIQFFLNAVMTGIFSLIVGILPFIKSERSVYWWKLLKKKA